MLQLFKKIFSLSFIRPAEEDDSKRAVIHYREEATIESGRSVSVATEDEEVKVSLYDEMRSLIELEAFERIIKLSREYNYYNAYPEMVCTMIEKGRYTEAREVVCELLDGPLASQARDLSDETFYYERVLFLLSLLDESSKDEKESDNKAESYLSNYASRVKSFSVFMGRAHTRPERDAARYARIAFKKVSTTMALFEDFLSADLFEGLSLEDDKKAKKRSKLSLDDSQVQMALANITDYIDGEADGRYRKTLLKLDLLTLMECMPIEEITRLSQKTVCYDLYPTLAQEYAELGDYDRAADLLAALIQETTLYDGMQTFVLEYLKSWIPGMLLQNIDQLDSQLQSQYLCILSEACDHRLAPTVLRYLQTRQLPLTISEESAPALDSLRESSTLYIQKREVPRPFRSYNEAVNWLRFVYKGKL